MVWCCILAVWIVRMYHYRCTVRMCLVTSGLRQVLLLIKMQAVPCTACTVVLMEKKVVYYMLMSYMLTCAARAPAHAA
jgi:hypothetical protein